MVVALLHPDEPQDADRWLFVHYTQLTLTPFLASAVWKLLDDIRSTVATLSRVALAIWMVFFGAYDATASVATGLLARTRTASRAQSRRLLTRAWTGCFTTACSPEAQPG
jgi:hypothetical protein